MHGFAREARLVLLGLLACSACATDDGSGGGDGTASRGDGGRVGTELNPASASKDDLDDCTRRSLLAPALLGAAPCGQRDAATDDDGGATDAGADAETPIVVECEKPTHGPTEHMGSVDTDTWKAADSPHMLPYGVSVTGTLTLEPCAEVLLGDEAALDVNAGAALVSEGTASRPIRIGAIDPDAPFLYVSASGGGTLRFAHTTIENGGAPSNSPLDTTGAIYAQGEDQTKTPQPIVFVDHVNVIDSASNGLQIQDGAGFAPGSRDLTVTGGAQYPISITPRAIDGIPTGTYTGNRIDEIVLPGIGGAGAIQEDQTTMHNRGVPYRVGNSLTGGTLLVAKQGGAPTGLATLTIEPGVIVRVKNDGVIHIQNYTGDDPATGAIIAAGTEDEPIVFTSAEESPAAGDWYGIWFGLVPDASNKMEHVRVEYAGRASGSGSNACNTPGTNDAAIRLFGTPAGQFVKNSTILDSAGHGIDRGWYDDFHPDFLPTNTFTRIAGCKQSEPRAGNGSCPMPVPCP